MDEKQRQLQQEKTERQLEQAKARLQLLDARAKQQEAEGAMAEISGLTTLHDHVKKQFRAWKEADLASAEALREDLQRAAEALSRGADAAADRLDRFADANDRFLDTEADQIQAAVQIFNSWLGEQWVEDKQAAAGAQADLRTAWEDAGKKLNSLKTAMPEKKDAARRDLAASLGRVKAKLKEVGARFKGAGKPAEQRT